MGIDLLTDLALLLFRVGPEWKCSPLASLGDSSVENALSKQIRAKGQSEAIVSVKQLPVLFLSCAPVNSPKPADWALWLGQGESHQFGLQASGQTL